MFGVTPTEIAVILRNAKPEYARMLEMNKNIPELVGCKLGNVFTNPKGDYFVFTGVNGRNRKYPCMATKVENRKTYKFPFSYFKKVANV